ncbi:IS21 family transposase [uncultured Brachyspira sp.]|uniref:IS21 family transposase n=1 Tax=uncultured Brachyspira sp. TaxID=221953 RepID=UPI00262205E5|nr:IS21 family transposase [uncultured Brachyspira sp.]
MIETFEMKPNFTYLGKKYDLDPRTIKKYYQGYNGKATTRAKPSMLDEYKDIIKEKLSYKGSKVSSLYFFLKNEKEYGGSYSTLTYYIRKHPDMKSNTKNESHVRFETKPGEQLQFDWVENIKMINKYGVEFEFNIFSTELSYSRMHHFNYSKYKTREDVLNNLVGTFKFYGGVTETVLTDNMSSIVNTNDKKFCKEFKSFAKDMGIKEKKCKVRHPYTKGKVEVRNKFMKWLIPYNYEFETEADIVEIIKKINIEVNNRINNTTGMKPILLYEKEKEYLTPLPNNQILEQYMNLSIQVKVQNTMLINYKGNQYSVPKKYINKTLKVKEFDNKLYIYDNTELIISHDIVANKKINYKEQHYIEGLQSSLKDKNINEIEELAKKNLELLDNLTTNRKKENNDK